MYKNKYDSSKFKNDYAVLLTVHNKKIRATQEECTKLIYDENISIHDELPTSPTFKALYDANSTTFTRRATSNIIVEIVAQYFEMKTSDIQEIRIYRKDYDVLRHVCLSVAEAKQSDHGFYHSNTNITAVVVCKSKEIAAFLKLTQ